MDIRTRLSDPMLAILALTTGQLWVLVIAVVIALIIGAWIYFGWRPRYRARQQQTAHRLFSVDRLGTWAHKRLSQWDDDEREEALRYYSAVGQQARIGAIRADLVPDNHHETVVALASAESSNDPGTQKWPDVVWLGRRIAKSSDHLTVEASSSPTKSGATSNVTPESADGDGMDASAGTTTSTSEDDPGASHIPTVEAEYLDQPFAADDDLDLPMGLDDPGEEMYEIGDDIGLPDFEAVTRTTEEPIEIDGNPDYVAGLSGDIAESPLLVAPDEINPTSEDFVDTFESGHTDAGMLDSMTTEPLPAELDAEGNGTPSVPHTIQDGPVGEPDLSTPPAQKEDTPTVADETPQPDQPDDTPAKPSVPTWILDARAAIEKRERTAAVTDITSDETGDTDAEQSEAGTDDAVDDGAAIGGEVSTLADALALGTPSEPVVDEASPLADIEPAGDVHDTTVDDEIEAGIEELADLTPSDEVAAGVASWPAPEPATVSDAPAADAAPVIEEPVDGEEAAEEITLDKDTRRAMIAHALRTDDELRRRAKKLRRRARRESDKAKAEHALAEAYEQQGRKKRARRHDTAATAHEAAASKLSNKARKLNRRRKKARKLS